MTHGLASVVRSCRVSVHKSAEVDMFFSREFSSPFRSLAIVTAFLLATTWGSAQAGGAPPQLTLLDPVPALLSGPMVTTDVNVLATKGRVVQGVAADGVTEMVLRVPANSAG